jgi:hypothetical protein
LDRSHPAAAVAEDHPSEGPGDAVAPGIVLLISGAGVLVAGVALIVLVLRMLVAQAVARDAEGPHLQAELDEVI